MHQVTEGIVDISFIECDGRPVGGKLPAFALQDLRAQGYAEFTVGVEKENHVAKHLYGKKGFTEVIGHGSVPCEYTPYLLKDEITR